MTKRVISLVVSPDSRDYVEGWARDLVASVGKREARVILADYRALARNAKLGKADREVAALRAKTLAKYL